MTAASNRPRYFALIPAAGVGARMEAGSPKQYLPIAGKPLLRHAVVAFLASPLIAHTYIVVSAEDGLIDTVVPEQGAGVGISVLRCGGAHLIVTERRKPFHRRDDFLALGLDPLAHTFTVVKIGYLEPELKAMARHHFLVLSPGAVNPSLTTLAYRNRSRPCFPWEDGFGWQAKARVFGAASRHTGS